uniref:Transposase IS116/IS110/IS902 family protein n=1 Tax=Candidatus Kentrum sp. LFY TaxID=2126342 RepID=A0A450V4C4_9GAMM|nr:MAG: Transposase IS116/IS110/IS902 family protein [Candidatus Kentron sp. LFY]VFJ99637.1 MAG: Transposase IS116/IS110/IS902 family protein [Candidatus Kentron sp. LFY]
MLLVEIVDDMTAFGTAEKLASWAGVCPGNHESAGKRVAGKKRKGNPHVRRILCEAANAAGRTRCACREKFESLLVRR